MKTTIRLSLLIISVSLFNSMNLIAQKTVSPANFQAFEVTPHQKSIKEGDTINLTATQFYASGRPQKVNSYCTWDFSPLGVLKNINDSQFVAIGHGDVKVFAVIGKERSSPATISVAAEITSLTINTKSKETYTWLQQNIFATDTLQYEAYGIDIYGVEVNLTENVVWSVNGKCASINSKGQVIGLAKGSVEISASYNDISSKKESLTIHSDNNELTINGYSNAPGFSQPHQGEIIVNTGEKFRVKVYITGSKDTIPNSDIKLFSQSPTTLSIDEDGECVANYVGQVTILVRVKGYLVNAFRVNVMSQIESIFISSETNIVGLGTYREVDLNVYKRMRSGEISLTEDIVKWSSENELIATIDDEGTFKPVSPGTVTFNAKLYTGYDTLMASTQITISGDFAELLIENIRQTIHPGDTLQLSPVYREFGYDDRIIPLSPRDVTWHSLNERIATINKKGILTAHQEGGVVVFIQHKNWSFKLCWIDIVKETKLPQQPEKSN